MTAKIIFHALKEPDTPEDFFKAVVLLAEKLYQSPGTQHLILLCDTGDLSTFDDLLWTLIPTSFIPHQINGEKTTPRTIDLTNDLQKVPSSSGKRVLINVSSMKPHHLDVMDEVHWIVGRTSTYREFCRSLFREFKKNGISPLSEVITV